VFLASALIIGDVVAGLNQSRPAADGLMIVGLAIVMITGLTSLGILGAGLCAALSRRVTRVCESRI
jgi:hypothetical protein